MFNYVDKALYLMDPIYSPIKSHHTIAKINKVTNISQYEPYLYYVAVFVGLILILGTLLLIAYKATSKKNN